MFSLEANVKEPVEQEKLTDRDFDTLEMFGLKKEQFLTMLAKNAAREQKHSSFMDAYNSLKRTNKGQFAAYDWGPDLQRAHPGGQYRGQSQPYPVFVYPLPMHDPYAPGYAPYSERRPPM